MSDKPKKEFWHLDIKPDEFGEVSQLDAHYADGWEILAPPQWDNVDKVWRILIWRDAQAPAPVATPPSTPTLIAETVPTDEAETVETPAPTPEPVSEETPIEAESTDKTTEVSPVIIVAPISAASLNFADELRRIRADKMLSPLEKADEIKRVGDEIVLAKARQAGELAWEAWNKLYPVADNFRFPFVESKMSMK